MEDSWRVPEASFGASVSQEALAAFPSCAQANPCGGAAFSVSNAEPLPAFEASALLPAAARSATAPAHDHPVRPLPRQQQPFPRDNGFEDDLQSVDDDRDSHGDASDDLDPSSEDLPPVEVPVTTVVRRNVLPRAEALAKVAAIRKQLAAARAAKR
eukprot:CAMPEP_0174850610 /NCGR_PEP_ID=MMETSP1114-20130205/20342_1 /TAXON_ID=312471 /ORGANISM="Neobodo designis, Strain CCAP 1951/1" /LENGTH=155 /DNA_ID=CAMNT_0016085079 /DNA_START=76 /DNA_END=543 /DNA_ORIENTATION=+